MTTNKFEVSLEDLRPFAAAAEEEEDSEDGPGYYPMLITAE
jgi:hypothetical protein